jgi:hypothetical protein
MLATGLNRCTRLKERGMVSVRGFICDQLRPAFRQRAGLVKGDYRYAVRNFQRFGILDQDAVTRRHAGADHDGLRRGKAQRTRTRND